MKKVAFSFIIFLLLMQKSFSMVKKLDHTGKKITLEEIKDCPKDTLIEISWINHDNKPFICTPGPVQSREHAQSIKEAFKFFIQKRGDNYTITRYETEPK